LGVSETHDKIIACKRVQMAATLNIDVIEPLALVHCLHALLVFLIMLPIKSGLQQWQLDISILYMDKLPTLGLEHLRSKLVFLLQ
jgi:hypothetical protein